jgi:hypothetical protein
MLNHNKIIEEFALTIKKLDKLVKIFWKIYNQSYTVPYKWVFFRGSQILVIFFQIGGFFF